MDVVTLKLEATVADLDALAGLAHCRVASKRRHRSLVARSIRKSSLRNVLRRLIERMLECDLLNSDLRISRCRFDL